MQMVDVDKMIRDLTAMKSVYDAISLDGMIKALKEQAVDAEPINYGEWIAIPVNGALKFRCSNIDCCRLIPSGCSPEELVYCPYCGARMDGKQT